MNEYLDNISISKQGPFVNSVLSTLETVTCLCSIINTMNKFQSFRCKVLLEYINSL